MNQPSVKLVKIGQAAKILGISIDTLRRWEKAGQLSSIKTPGGTRFYKVEDLEKLQAGIPASLASPDEVWEPKIIPSKTNLEQLAAKYPEVVNVTETQEEFSQGQDLHSNARPDLTQILPILATVLILAVITLTIAFPKFSPFFQPQTSKLNPPTGGQASNFQPLASNSQVLAASASAYLLTIKPDTIFEGLVAASDLATTGTLTVDSTSTFSGLSTFTRGLTSRGTTRTTNLISTGTTTLNNTGSGNSLLITDEASDITPFVIDNGGNVGIGTTSTNNYKLYVNGTSNLTGATTIGSTLTVTGVTTLNGNVGIGTTSTAGYTVAIGGPITVTGATTLGSSLTVSSDTTLSSGLSVSGLANFTQTGTSALFTGNVGIGTSGGGNIGIGTTVPGAKIHALSPTEQLRLGYSTTSYTSFLTNSGGDLTITPSGGDTTVTGNLTVTGTSTLSSTLSLIDGSAATPGLNFTNDTDSGLWRITDNTIALTTGGSATKGITIDSSGNLGIGITSPANKLDVSGSMALGSYAGVAAPSNGLIVSGNVGIGVTNPGYKLAVVGTANFSGGNIGLASGTSIIPDVTGGSDLGTSDYKFNTLWVNGINSNSTLSSSGQGVFTYSPTSNAISQASVWINPTTATAGYALLGVSVGGIEKSRITSEGYLGLVGNDPGTTNIINAGSIFNIKTSGNVGIGTTNPGNLLTVFGGNVGIGTTAFVNARLSVMGGNLGIGTTAPSTALHVVGNITSPGGDSTSEKFGANASASGGLGEENTAFGASAQSTGGRGTAVGYVAIASGYRGTAIGNESLASGTQSTAIGKSTTASATDSIAIGWNSVADVANIFVAGGNSDAISNVYFGSGRVDASPSDYTINGTGGSGTDIAGGSLQLAGGQGTGTGAGGSINFLTTPASTTGSSLNSLTERMRINSSGNIGIGTTSPASLLQLRTVAGSDPSFSLADADVGHGVTDIAPTDDFLRIVPISSTVGGAYINGLADATGIALQLRGIQSSDPTDSTPAIKLIGAKASGTGVADLAAAETIFAVANNDDANALTILGNGKVGIGSTNPGAKLEIDEATDGSGNGGIRFYLDKATYSTVYSGIFDQGGDGGLVLYNAYANSGGGITFDTGGAVNPLKITNDGNIGIGTTNPANLLTISGGNVGIGTTANVNAALSVMGGNVGIGTTSPVSRSEIWGAGTAAALTFLTRDSDGTNRFSILDNGNVGIGTTAPTSLLDIGSTLIASDTFTRADGAMGNAETGQAWSNGANVTISSNQATTSNDSNTLIDAGQKDVTVEVDVYDTNYAVNGPGIYFRYDLTNGMIAYLYNGAVRLERLYSANNAQLTSTAMTLTNSQTYRLKAVASGNTIDIYVDGVSKISYTLQAGTEQNNLNTSGSTYVGLNGSLYGTDANTRWDNFRVQTSSYSLASAAGADKIFFSVGPGIVDLTGTTQITSLMETAKITGAILSDVSALTVDKATALSLSAPVEGSANLTLTNSSALRVLSSVGSPTTNSGIWIESQTAGATNNYGLYLAGASGGSGTNASLYIDTGNTILGATSGNVGIGVTDPGYLLELKDDTNTPTFALSDDDIAHGVTTVAQTDSFFHLSSISTTDGGAYLQGIADNVVGATALQLRGIQASDPTDTVPAIKLIGAKASGTGVADLGAAETVFQIANNDDAAALTIQGNGEVGIGTTSPTGILELSSANPLPRITWTDTANYGALSFYETTTQVGGIQAIGSTFATVGRRNDFEIFNNGASGDITFWTNSAENMVIKTGGNIGIGTTSPTNALVDINNATAYQAAVNASPRILGISGNITKSGGGITSRIMGVEINPPTITGTTSNVQNSTTLYISAAPDAGESETKYSLWIDAGQTRLDGNVGIGYAGDFQGALVVNGNVGIGTSQPSSLLHILGTQPADNPGGTGYTATAALTIAGGTGGNSSGGAPGGVGSLLSFTSGTGGTNTSNSGPGTAGAGGAISLTTGTGGAIATTTATNLGGAGGNMTLATGNGGASSGGTGTNTGGVGGSLSLVGGSGGAASGTGATGGNGGNIFIVGGAAGSGGSPLTGNVLLGITSTGTARGSVGIGTTNPGNLLTVNGGNVGIGTTAAVGNALVVDGNVGIGTTAFVNAALSVMGGNVGIGTTSPVSRSEIWGTGTSTALTFLTRGSGGVNGLAVLDNGNVGIGTTSPAQIFQVGTGSNVLAFDSTYGSLGIGTTTPGVIVNDTFTRDDSATTLGSATSGQSWTTYDSTTWGISSNQAYKVSGGNNHPIVAVESGLSDATVQVTVATFQGNIDGLVFRLSDSSNYWTIRADTNVWHLSKVEAGDYVNYGNVGASSGDILKVVLSGSSITAYKNGDQFASTTNTFNQTSTKHGFKTKYDASTARFDNFTVSKNLMFDLAGSGRIIPDTAATIGLTIQGAASQTGNLLQLQNSSFTTLSYINSAGGAYFAGNVGIGTTNPGNLLTISGGNVGIGTTAFVNAALSVMGGNVGIGTTTSSISRMTVLGIGTGTGLSFLTQDSAGTNKFAITDAGNVGIGTTQPNRKLEIADATTGILRLTRTATGNSAGNLGTIEFYDSWTSNPGINAQISGYDKGANEIGNLLFSTRTNGGALTEAMRINSTQRVGINNTDPQTRLHISGDTGSALRLNSISSSVYWDLAGGISGVSHDYFGMAASGSVKVAIKDTGEFGIGDTSPDNLFTVGSSSQFQVDSAGAIAAVTGITTSGGYTQSGTGLNKFTGNVGIGTTNPGNLLTVNGGNVGIGTTAAVGNALVVDGNVGIGTTAFVNARLSVMGGNVGIGTTTPTQMLAVGSSSQFNVSSAGAVTAVGVNSGSGLIQGTGGLTVTGTGNINATGTAATNIGNSTGALTLASGGTSAWTNTSGDLTISTATSGTLALTSAAALNLTAGGTSAMTFTSTVTTGNTTSSGFVFSDASLTSGTGMHITSSNTSLSSGKLLDVSSTALFTSTFTGALANVEWSPSSAPATNPSADLFRIKIGANGTTTGNLFNILDSSTSIFSVSETAVTTSLPTNFTSSGDVSIAYDINFTNPTASYIKSQAPLYLQAGETFNSSDLTLKTFNQGSIVLSQDNTVASGATSYGVQIASSLIDNAVNPTTHYSLYNVPTMSITGDTLTSMYSNYIGFTNTAGTATNWYGQYIAAPTGSGTTSNKFALVTEASSGNVGIGTTNPGNILSIVGGNVGIGTTANVNTGANPGLVSMGNIGIGTTSPTQALEVTGRIVMSTWTADGETAVYKDDPTGTIGIQTSDIRLKKNLTPYSGALDLISELPTYLYNTFDEADGSKKRLGIMAQDILSVLPELSFNFTNNETGEQYFGVHYDKLGVVAIQGIKEQQTLINAQARNMSLNTDGNLIVSAPPSGKIIINGTLETNRLLTTDYSLDPQTLTSGNLATTTGEDGNTYVDVLASLINLDTEQASQSAQLAQTKEQVDVLSAQIASLSAQLASSSAIATSSASPSADPSTNAADLASLGLTDPSLLIATGSASLANLTVTSEATISGKLAVYGQAVLSNTLIAGDLNVDGTMSISGSSLSNLNTLYIQNGPLATGVDFFNGAITIDNKGTLVAQTISAKELKLQSGQSVGSAKISAGTNSIEINSPLVKSTSKILITPTISTYYVLGVSAKLDGQKFTVATAQAVSQDLPFDWILINEQ